MAKLTPSELAHMRANPDSYLDRNTITALVDHIYALEAKLEPKEPRIQDTDAD